VKYIYQTKKYLNLRQKANRVAGGFSPPAPHHPACGSTTGTSFGRAPGGSRIYPGRSQVMDLHLLLFNGNQTLPFKPFIAHGTLCGKCFRQMPQSFPAHPNCYRVVQRTSQPDKIPNTGATPWPLLPVAHSEITYNIFRFF